MRKLATVREIKTIKPIEGVIRNYGRNISFKVINPEFLLSEEDWGLSSCLCYNKNTAKGNEKTST